MRKFIVFLAVLIGMAFFASSAHAIGPGPYPPTSWGWTDGYGGDQVTTLKWEEATQQLATRGGTVPDMPPWCASYLAPGSVMRHADYQFVAGGYGCATTYYVGRSDGTRWNAHSVTLNVNIYRPSQRIYCRYWGTVDKYLQTNGYANYTVNGVQQITCGPY